MHRMLANIGVVAIGRNEGPRLRRCLESAAKICEHVVYVDSGSTDDSISIAQSIGASIVRLDTTVPFTAARSRNAGIARLKAIAPHVDFVQVVDGDCEIVDGWMSAAIDAMEQNPMAAVVCGRRRERHPDASVYNTLCDMEWNTPLGEASWCGGDALIRMIALEQIQGYNESLIAGEEPEMCLRLRQNGWMIQRIDHEMTLHDANIHTLRQWWRRAVRSGHAYAEVRTMHAASPHRIFVNEIRSIVEWALVLPLIAFGLAWMTWGASLLLFGGYIVLWHRVRNYQRQRSYSDSDAALYARYCVLGKFAEFTGVMKYWWNRFRGRQTQLIEYKFEGTTDVRAPLAEMHK